MAYIKKLVLESDVNIGGLVLESGDTIYIPMTEDLFPAETFYSSRPMAVNSLHDPEDDEEDHAVEDIDHYNAPSDEAGSEFATESVRDMPMDFPEQEDEYPVINNDESNETFDADYTSKVLDDTSNDFPKRQSMRGRPFEDPREDIENPKSIY